VKKPAHEKENVSRLKRRDTAIKNHTAPSASSTLSRLLNPVITTRRKENKNKQRMAGVRNKHLNRSCSLLDYFARHWASDTYRVESDSFATLCYPGESVTPSTVNLKKGRNVCITSRWGAFLQQLLKRTSKSYYILWVCVC